MDYLPFIVEKVREAGALLLRLRDKGFSSEGKGGDTRDIVTSVDLAVDEFLVTAIKETYPDHSIYSEEAGNSGRAGTYQWVIDPIDGSSNFSRGIPHYAVCLGVLEDNIPIAGAVYNPVTKELFSFRKGGGAFLNEVPIHVSPTTNLASSWILLHAGRRPDLQAWGGESYRRLLGAAKKTGNLSSCSLDTCFVAAGRVEASIYGTFSTLDTAPALGILGEAGGVVSCLDGTEPELVPEAQMIFVANNKTTVDAVRELLA
jgi:myo-inositol-1(or 4)-monophosphatase